MAWIESHQEIVRHPKTKRLARLLGVSIPTAMGHLHCLWYWALDFAQDGYVSKYNGGDLADAALWEGDVDLFTTSLIESGWLDVEGDATLIHDWWDYAGKLLERRRKDVERKRNSARFPVDVHRNSDGKRMDSVTNPGVPNRTVPNTTAPNNNNTEVPSSSFEDYCQAIESKMVACGANPNYTATKDSYTWAKKFFDSAIPIDFVQSVIVGAYQKNPDISTFSYCAKIVQAEWEKELVKNGPSQPIEFKREIHTSVRASPNYPDLMQDHDIIEFMQVQRAKKDRVEREALTDGPRPRDRGG